MQTLGGRAPVRVGLESFVQGNYAGLRGKRIGLITNHSAIDHNLDHAIDLINASEDVHLAALLGPEHGVRGSAQAGEHVTSSVDNRTGLPAHSLFGDTRRPTPEMLNGLDALVYDVADIGVRYATYITTLLEAMRAAAQVGLAFVVLDRPNPLNGIGRQGNMLEPGHESFVGAYPLPVRHGLTVGEFARLADDRLGLGLDLTVVPMDGWRRTYWYDDTDVPWVPPSPNLPTLTALALYPGTCLIEGTNLSEGRGTTTPFEIVGAPWLDAEALAQRLRATNLPGAGFRPTTFVPTFSKHAGQQCQAVHIHVLDRAALNAAALGVHLLAAIHDLHGRELVWMVAQGADGNGLFLDLLAGSPELRSALERGERPEHIVEAWTVGLRQFADVCAPYQIYDV